MKNYLDILLVNYTDKDYALQLKAKFVLLFSFVVILAVTVTTVYSTVLANSFEIVVFPLTILFLIVMSSLFLIVKGKYHIAVHIIIASSLIVTWFTLFFEPVGAINKTNSIVYIIAVLSATPLLLSNKKHPLIAYFSVNIMLFIIYCYFLSYSNILLKSELVDYIVDNMIALLFVFAVSYYLYSINQQSLKKIKFDLVEKKRTARELNEVRTLLSNIINHMPSVLIGVNRDFKITCWNNEAEKLTGIDLNQAEGLYLFEVFPQLLKQEQDLKSVIDKGILFKNERIQLNKTAESSFIDFTIYPLINESIDGAVIRMDDITERIKMEEMIAESKKMVTLGGLTAGMAHEINNPLAGMMQNAQLIKNRLSAENKSNIAVADEIGISIDKINQFSEKRNIPEIISNICKSGEKVAKLTHEMLSVSNPSVSPYIAHNISEIIEKTIDLSRSDYELKNNYGFRNIDIIRNYQPNMPDLYCSETKLKQVFLNLIKNSAVTIHNKNYENNEKPQIQITIKNEKDNICIEFADNGSGMSENVLKRIFEPFYTTMQVGKGTGLGLYIVYFIITKNQGGSIEAESKPGKGTKFIIRLPINYENSNGQFN